MCTESLSPHTTQFVGSYQRPVAGRSGRLTVWLHTMVLWYERAKQRNALLELDERLLLDIGVTRAQALAEARKPFWRP